MQRRACAVAVQASTCPPPQIAYDMAADPALAAVVDVVTTHVAGSLEENTPTPAAAIGLGKPLWQVRSLRCL